MSQAVTYESNNNIALITINRPERLNAINEEVEVGLANAWRKFNQSNDRVAVLTGAGDKAFSVGKDLEYKAFPEFRRFVPGCDIEVRKPIVAAVSGWCIGGAITLVQMADLCVASETAKFTYPEAKLGFAGGLIAGLVSRIPHKVAMELMLLGEEISAERAYQVGLVNKLTPPGEHLKGALIYAERLAKNAPLVLEMLKTFGIRTLPKSPMEEASFALREVDLIKDSSDRLEGLDSFSSKRQPQYKGK
ncbi:enoyl-CoA hydratase-related protein [Polynucleobacter sp.]|jgi:enoyl-CoA hydratase|uniref:enoyl-CoA hydratase-related protein n=1 Tax=Polynucleobacter sp. TaxID=2029855 RepID=UPI0030182860